MLRRKALIIDMRPLYREGLRQMLRQIRFSIILSEPTLGDALAKANPEEDIDLAVCTLDKDFNRMTIEALVELRHRYPNAKMVLLSDETLARSLTHDVIEISDAVLLHDVTGEMLAYSIALVMLGERFVSTALIPAATPEPAEVRMPEVVARTAITWEGSETTVAATTPSTAVSLVGDPSVAKIRENNEMPLSDRERQILTCLTKGYSNKLIGRELQIADATVKVHVKGLLRKLHATNRTQAAIWAISRGLQSNENAALNGVKTVVDKF